MPNELIKRAKALIDRATPVLWFIGPLADIRGLKHCLDRFRDKETKDGDVIRYINNVEEYLVSFGKKCERLQEFLESSPQLTEDLQNMAKEMLAEAQNMFKDLQKFLREEIWAITSSRPVSAVMLTKKHILELIKLKLPNLVTNNKKIIENISNLLGLTTKVAESSKEHTRTLEQQE